MGWGGWRGLIFLFYMFQVIIVIIYCFIFVNYHDICGFFFHCFLFDVFEMLFCWCFDVFILASGLIKILNWTELSLFSTIKHNVYDRSQPRPLFLILFNCLYSGGTNAAPGQYPWMVSFQQYGIHKCGGSIISPYFILTAGHCVE